MQSFPGRPEQRDVFEIEVRGTTVETVTIKKGGAPRFAQTSYSNVAQAERAMRDEIARKQRARYVEVGASQLLASTTTVTGSGSTLMLDELFNAGDPRFLEEVLASTADKKLATLAVPWIDDHRPQMRRALLDYVDDGCDRYGHRGLVKKLFKSAEAKSDDELLAHFMVAFDRLSRRFVVERRAWDRGGWVTRKALVSDPVVPAKATVERAGRFSRATRLYLARRVFRHFRRIGKHDLPRYVRAMDIALPLWRDDHLADVAGLLDAWSLLHTLYGWSNVLDRKPRGIVVKPNHTLADLTPAPYFPKAFEGRRDALLSLLATARSRTVRTWTIAWLKKHYASELAGLHVTAIRPLLASTHDEVTAFGASLLASAKGLETIAIDEWLRLLAIEHLDVVPLVVAAFEKHVSPKRLDLAQCVGLAQARVAGVAELGLRWAKERRIVSADELAIAARVTKATVGSVRLDGARWVLGLLDASPNRRPEHLRDLFDSNFADVRKLAEEYVATKPEAASVPLWFALVESPFDDVRALVVKNAEKWQNEAGSGEIELLASTVLLAVHRGAATKQAMLRRIADRAAEKPADAERLLPILALALRSVRPPERTGALAAIARAAVAHEELRSAVAKHLPELSVSAEVVL
jgi:hypothetical protein